MMNYLNVSLVLIWVNIFQMSCSQSERSPACTVDGGCGWNSFCSNGQCACIPGHSLASNRRDCYEDRCQDTSCLECIEPNACRRCLEFIEAGTGRCLDGCHSAYMLVIEGTHVGKVCPVSDENDSLKLYVAIVIGIGAGLFLTSLAVLCFCWQMKNKTQRKEKASPPSRLDIEKLQNCCHTNKAFDNIYIQNGVMLNGQPGNVTKMNGIHSGVLPPSPMDIQVYLNIVNDLRPHMDTFLRMLKEVKMKNASLANGDNRGLVYKNIIHQLLRVLTLLNTNEEQSKIPSDAVLLMKWAQNLLQTYSSIKECEYWDPGSPVSTMTSTFKPDLKLIPNGTSPGDHHANNAYTYERYGPHEPDNISDDYRSLTISLQRDYTEPIEV